jgi:opacity protein-like surface antigen
LRIACACKAFLLASLATLGATAARAQTDVAASIYGSFTTSTNSISPSSAAGGLLELRHISNPLVGYEATYAYNRANQSETNTAGVVPSCPAGNCAISFTQAVPANAHAITGDWIASLKVADLRPFALAGGGVLFHVPAVGAVPVPDGEATTSTQTKGVFVYGAGVDWGLLPHIGLRLQYRGNVYKLSGLINGLGTTSSFTHTAQPMLGVYFRL